MTVALEAKDLEPLQLVVLVLSLFVLTLLAVELVVEVPHEIERLIAIVDDTVCIVFFSDFVVRYRRAESKREFMKWGWVDLLASVPALEVFRLGRLLRVFRLLRLFRAVRSLRSLFGILFRSRTRGGVASVGMLTYLILACASIGILAVERTPDSNIHTAEDALWWSVTTITTVGYGDRFPVTGAGRMIAAMLMLSGVGLFGTLSGVIAGFFVGDEKFDPSVAREAALRDRIAQLEAELAAATVAAEDQAEHEAGEDGEAG